MSLEEFKQANKGEKAYRRMGNNPNKEAINYATANNMRWVKIEQKNTGQHRYGGESHSYYNYGINGAKNGGVVGLFAMRPGWHAGSLPTMRQIGKGPGRNLRDDRFVWVEGEISADVDYNEEAQGNPDNDIPTHIPVDGFYLKATNANAKASQADRVGWYISGAFKPNKIIGDREARAVIDAWNADPKHKDLQVEYDYPRESGKEFNAETMQLEETGGVRFSFSKSREEFDATRDRAVAEDGIVMPGLNEAEVEVTPVKPHDFNGERPISQAKAWAKEHLVTKKDTNGNYIDMPKLIDGTPYIITVNGVKEYLTQQTVDKTGDLRLHLSVLKQLKDVISRSIEGEIHASRKKDKDGHRSIKNGIIMNQLVHRYYGAVSYDGDVYIVKTTIIEERDGDNRAYTYEVTDAEIELAEVETSTKAEPMERTHISTANLLRKVKKSNESGKKLLDESAKTTENGEEKYSLDAAVAEAEQMTDTEPTDGQKESGNYRKGHVKVDGFDVSIEQPKGSVRRGVDADGKEWSQEMHNTYGYIRGTEGVDGDHIDMFLSDHLDNWNGKVFVVDQVNKDGSFDEHKVMYGFNSEQEAREAYLSNYEEGWTGLGTITGVDREEFRKWIDSSHRKTKPFAEYSGVRVSNAQNRDITGRQYSLSDDAKNTAEEMRNNDEYRKKVSDATERIERRLAELHRYDDNEQSSIPENGDSSDQPAKAAVTRLDGGNANIGAQSVAQSGAKVNKKLQPANKMAKRMADFVQNLPEREDVDSGNFGRAMIKALGLTGQKQESQYVFFVSPEGDTITLRVGDHHGNARNIIIKGVKTDSGVSIVLQTDDSSTTKFKGTKWAKVDEYIYKDPDKERLINIAKSIFGLFDSGEYVDLANADGMYLYKRDEASGQKQFSLSEEQTHSENFKRWFGDWENDPEHASKVVDKNGEPKVVLHGTPNGDFYVFDPEKAGSNTDQGWLGTGFYFYGNASEYASQYAGKNGRVLQVYLDIKNPYIASVEEFNRLAEANDPEMSRRFREQLEDEGYDGVYYNGDLNEEWVAFRPEQIKSATDNNGDFSRENPDIRYSLSEEDQGLFDGAKRKFGVTSDIREAGYVLPDGSMLDFSGRHELDPGTDSSFLAGRRATDHRAINQISFIYDENGDEVLAQDLVDQYERDTTPTSCG